MATMQSIRQVVIDALPTSGEVTFDELKQNLLNAGHEEAPAQLMRFKHEGAIKMRLDTSNPSQPVLFVSRGEGE